LLLYSSKPSLGVYQLAGHFTSSTLPIKFSGTIITAPSAGYSRPGQTNFNMIFFPSL
jgi:hypothetical protein